MMVKVLVVVHVVASMPAGTGWSSLNLTRTSTTRPIFKKEYAVLKKEVSEAVLLITNSPKHRCPAGIASAVSTTIIKLDVVVVMIVVVATRSAVMHSAAIIDDTIDDVVAAPPWLFNEVPLIILSPDGWWWW